jgi:hypothetical protein
VPVIRKTLLMSALLLLAWVVFTPRFITGSHSEAGRQKIPAPALNVNQTSFPSESRTPEDGLDSLDNDDVLGPVDLYGNEVTDAVAKYRLDASGMLYELHSPRTEVPRLGSPKS